MEYSRRFEAIKDKRIGDMTDEEKDLAYEKWMRDQIGFIDGQHGEHVRILLRQIDRERG